MKWAIGVFALIAVLAAQTPPAGKVLFDKRCGGCHALDRDKEGPRLGGVYGRRAGSVEGFDYSAALKNSKIAWDARSLDQWLANTESLVPNNDMAFHVESAGERQAIVEYLRMLPSNSAR